MEDNGSYMDDYGDSTRTTTERESPVTISVNNVIVGVVLIILVLLTIAGNILVLLAVYLEKRLRTTFNFYIVNLAVTDLAVAVTAMSFYSISNILGYWPFGQFMCAVWIFFDYGMTFVSVFTLLLISIDRFWSVTWYIHYRQNHSKNTCLMSIAVAWIAMLILWLPACIKDRVENSVPGECKWEPSLNPVFVIIVASLGHHGSCFVLLFCYIRVFMGMRNHRRINTAGVYAQSVNAEPSNTRDVQATVITTIAQAELPMPGTSNESETNMPKTINNNAGNFTWEECLTQGNVRKMANKNACQSKIDEQNRHRTANNPTKRPVISARQNTVYNETSMIGHEQIPNRDRNAVKGSRHRRDLKVFVTLSYIIAGYLICWVPFHFVFDISCVDNLLVPEYVFNVTFWMTYMNSTINPILYNFSSHEFREAFRKILSRRFQR